MANGILLAVYLLGMIPVALLVIKRKEIFIIGVACALWPMFFPILLLMAFDYFMEDA